VVVTVNSTTRTNQNLTNTARFTYAYGGLTYTVNSSVSYRLIGSTTLPGTGGIQLSSSDSLGPPASSARWQSPERTNPLVGIARLAALTLGGLGAAGILYGWRTRRAKPEWGAWYMKIGGLFAAVGLFFGLASMALSSVPSSLSPPPAAQATEPGPPVANLPGDLGGEGGPRGQYYPVQPDGEPETLPDFPIPTPLVATEEPGEEPLDISAVERIVIPALGVDTIVKYVPFDGITWLIAGLQQEVAWMGDTSWPGLGSNTALAGHVTLRNGAQGPFYELQSLKNGDEIFVYTAEKVYTYQVAEGRTIEETDFSVIAPSDQARLTLITCTEWDEQMRFYLKRYIVGADLVQSRSRTTAAGFVDSILP
jgi:LPXTG-site transpeptidase (sortase) family protein